MGGLGFAGRLGIGVIFADGGYTRVDGGGDVFLEGW